MTKSIYKYSRMDEAVDSAYALTRLPSVTPVESNNYGHYMATDVQQITVIRPSLRKRLQAVHPNVKRLWLAFVGLNAGTAIVIDSVFSAIIATLYLIIYLASLSPKKQPPIPKAYLP